MAGRPPTLTQQIVAVQWAIRYAPLGARKGFQRANVIEALSEALEAALATLTALEFANAKPSGAAPKANNGQPT